MGLVERAPADGDRRSIVLIASAQGEGLLEKVKEAILRRYQDLFHHLGPTEQANLAGAIHTLVRILEKAHSLIPERSLLLAVGFLGLHRLISSKGSPLTRGVRSRSTFLKGKSGRAENSMHAMMAAISLRQAPTVFWTASPGHLTW
jgi:hypothetical protein